MPSWDTLKPRHSKSPPTRSILGAGLVAAGAAIAAHGLRSRLRQVAPPEARLRRRSGLPHRPRSYRTRARQGGAPTRLVDRTERSLAPPMATADPPALAVSVVDAYRQARRAFGRACDVIDHASLDALDDSAGEGFSPASRRVSLSVSPTTSWAMIRLREESAFTGCSRDGDENITRATLLNAVMRQHDQRYRPSTSASPQGGGAAPLFSLSRDPRRPAGPADPWHRCASRLPGIPSPAAHALIRIARHLEQSGRTAWK